MDPLSFGEIVIRILAQFSPVLIALVMTFVLSIKFKSKLGLYGRLFDSLIGMIGFIASNAPTTVAEGLLSPNSAMPAQIYEWAKRADPAFYERAWGGIIILLIFLVTMNTVAVLLRRRFERRW